MSQIHVRRTGQQYGPYTLSAAQQFIASGKLDANDSAWAEGHAGWKPLAEVIAIERWKVRSAIGIALVISGLSMTVVTLLSVVVDIHGESGSLTAVLVGQFLVAVGLPWALLVLRRAGVAASSSTEPSPLATPQPASAPSPEARLQKLQGLKDQGLISDPEYLEKKKAILNHL